MDVIVLVLVVVLVIDLLPSFDYGYDGRILTLLAGRSADFPVRSNVERQEGFRRLLEPWEARELLRTGKSALRWRSQDAHGSDNEYD